jgi:hypothetical protein
MVTVFGLNWGKIYSEYLGGEENDAQRCDRLDVSQSYGSQATRRFQELELFVLLDLFVAEMCPSSNQ